MNISEEEKALLTQKVEAKEKHLKRMGWSKEAVDVFLSEVKQNFETALSYDEAKNLLENQSEKIYKIGSDLYTSMLQAGTNKAIDKLKTMEKNVILDYKMDESLNEESEFFDCVNEIVAQAVADGDLYSDLASPPSSTDYFVLTTMNQLFNNLITSKYQASGRGALEAMFENGWELCNANSQNALLNGSRYHAIGIPVQIDEDRLYDPAYNIKILSKNKKFEQIYNMDLEMFLNEIYENCPHVKAESGHSTNLATYNYGYRNIGKNSHAKLDVAPFNVWGNDYNYKRLGLEVYEETLARQHESGYAENADCYVENWEKFHDQEKGCASEEKVKEKIKEKFGLEREKEGLGGKLDW